MEGHWISRDSRVGASCSFLTSPTVSRMQQRATFNKASSTSHIVSTTLVPLPGLENHEGNGSELSDWLARNLQRRIRKFNWTMDGAQKARKEQLLKDSRMDHVDGAHWEP